MKIKRQDLVDILSTVRPGLSKKAILEQSMHFVMTGSDIVTYNDRICIIHPFKTDFSCSVSAEEFYKILTGIAHEEIEISFKEDKIRIKGKGLNAGLTTHQGDDIMSMIDLLDIESAKNDKQPLPEDFLEAISMCLFSASKDLTNPGMTCLLIEDHYIASTDDIRISEYEMKTAIGISVLLPSSSASELVKFNVTHCSTSKDNSWAFFFDEKGLTFCSRLVEADFPAYSKFLNDFGDQEIKLPSDAKRMIQTAAVLSDGETDQEKEIDIEIQNGVFRVKGQNAVGWIENETKIDFKSNDVLRFSINPFFMLKIMEKTQSMFYGEGKALFRSKNFQHVIALRVPE